MVFATQLPRHTPQVFVTTLHATFFFKDFKPLQFYSMKILQRRYWNVWQHRRQRRQFQRMLQKQEAILQFGICIHARVVEVYDTGKCFQNLKHLQLRLCIELPGGARIHPLSACLLSELYPIEGKNIRMRLLPGDLSQVVLMI
jgi:hypothetical protein